MTVERRVMTAVAVMLALGGVAEAVGALFWQPVECSAFALALWALAAFIYIVAVKP